MEIPDCDGYRVHPAGEALTTVLNPARPDGWTADDEGLATQPHGVSAAQSMNLLASYVHHYSMAVRDNDVVLGLYGSDIGGDRDKYATRVVVESYVVICTGAEFRQWMRDAE